MKPKASQLQPADMHSVIQPVQNNQLLMGPDTSRQQLARLRSLIQSFKDKHVLVMRYGGR